MTSTISKYIAPVALALSACASVSGPSVAGSDFDHVSSVSFVPGWQREDGLYVGAILIDLEEGWKTYWRSPGYNGIAPEFKWSGSSNLEQVGYFWPSPEIFETGDFRTIGYEQQLLLPVLLKPKNSSAPLSLNLSVEYGVCEEICVPAYGSTSALLDMGLVQNQAAIQGAIEKRSRPAAEAGLVSASCSLRPSGDDFILSAEFQFEGDLGAHRLVVVETGSELIWSSDADHSISGGTLRVETDLQFYGEGAMTLDRSNLRFTLMNDGSSIEITGCSGV